MGCIGSVSFAVILNILSKRSGLMSLEHRNIFILSNTTTTCSEVNLQPPQSQVAGSDRPATSTPFFISGEKFQKIILVGG